MNAFIDGTEVKVGDIVGFKSDIEQAGRIVEITPAKWGNGKTLHLVPTSDSGFSGEYIGGSDGYQINASDCWVD